MLSWSVVLAHIVVFALALCLSLPFSRFGRAMAWVLAGEYSFFPLKILSSAAFLVDGLPSFRKTARVIYEHQWMVRGLILFGLMGTAEAVCGICKGALPSCDHGNTGTCILTTSTAANVIGIASGVAASVSVARMMGDRFARLLPPGAISILVSLANRGAPGSSFVVSETTPISEVMAALDRNSADYDAVTRTMAGFVHTIRQVAIVAGRVLTDLEKDKIQCHVDNMKILKDTRRVETSGSQSLSSNGVVLGHLSYLWARVVDFVLHEGMDDKLALAGIYEQGMSPSRMYKANYIRPKTFYQFFEAINLFVMYLTSLGLSPPQIICEFLEATVFDMMRKRGYPWQFSCETLFVMLRKIEDSQGTFTFVNIHQEVYIQGILDEVRYSMHVHFPSVHPSAYVGHVPFRTLGGIPGTSDDEAVKAVNDKKVRAWNNKTTDTKDDGSDTKPCTAFNQGRPHRHDELYADGTCKKRHVCFNWVSHKGPGGQCCEGHASKDCTNPKRCADKAQ